MRTEFIQAAQNMAVGILVVFAILFFLMLVISMFRFLPKAEGKAEEKEIRETPAATTIPENGAEEEELAAVFAAAIAAAQEDSSGAATYQVRRIRRLEQIRP